MESPDKTLALLETVFFLETEPIDENALMRISGLSREDIEKALEAFINRFLKEDSGLELVRIGGGFLLAPKKEYWEILKDRYGKKNEGRLSRAAMETLSIIAYSQPVTRAEVKDIRGVEPDNMIRFLLEKNLIREVGKKDAPGKPVQYGTTRDFLQIFRLNSIADLPKLDKSEADRFELDGDN
jgi:segregation and condensation protein B